MLTALILADREPMALAETLSALVPAVAEGLMSHAVVVSLRPDADFERIADAMGAAFVVAPSEPWRTGARAARGQWLLLLAAGEAPEQGWISAAEGHLIRHGQDGRAALLPLAGAWDALAEAAGRRLGLIGLGSGVLAPRDRIIAGRAPGPLRRLAAARRRSGR